MWSCTVRPRLTDGVKPCIGIKKVRDLCARYSFCRINSVISVSCLWLIVIGVVSCGFSCRCASSLLPGFCSWLSFKNDLMNTRASNQSKTVRNTIARTLLTPDSEHHCPAVPARAGSEGAVQPEGGLPGLYSILDEGWPISLQEIRHRIRIAQS